MFSSDKNVESIAQLVESVKSYVGLQGEYLKLDVIQKVVRLPGLLPRSPILPDAPHSRLLQSQVVD